MRHVHPGGRARPWFVPQTSLGIAGASRWDAAVGGAEMQGYPTGGRWRLVPDTRDCAFERQGRMVDVEVPFFDVHGEKVWGATAMVLAEFLALQLRESPAR